jgi:predicted MFS family arabinose efflux permease
MELMLLTCQALQPLPMTLLTTRIEFRNINDSTKGLRLLCHSIALGILCGICRILCSLHISMMSGMLLLLLLVLVVLVLLLLLPLVLLLLGSATIPSTIHMSAIFFARTTTFRGLVMYKRTLKPPPTLLAPSISCFQGALNNGNILAAIIAGISLTHAQISEHVSDWRDVVKGD